MSVAENNIVDEIEFVDRNGTRMTWFRAFRDEFGYSNYGEYRTSVTQDIPYATVIYACVLISVAALIAAAGIRGKERWYTLLRLMYSLAVGSIVLVSIFGYCWQMGHVNVHSPYIYRSRGEIQGTLGVRIGLRTVNLTLSGSFMNEKNTFDYNEELTLEDVIFGPKSDLELGLNRGLPQPLLSAIEYFSTDEGEMRFGRSYFMAGYIAHILLWTAFAFWVTGNILLCSVVWYGALLFTLTGLCMAVAAVVFHCLCPTEPMKLPCADGVLEMSYGWCFWSNSILGAITVIIGLVLFTLDQKVPNKLAEFFLLDTLADDNADEYKQICSPPGISRSNTPSTPLNSLSGKSEKKRLSPVNWYMNNGYDPGHKDNPVFVDTHHETAPANRTCDHHRHNTVFNGIIEEDSDGDERTDSMKAEMTRKMKESQDVQDMNRLKQIYVDIEPNSCHGTSGYGNELLVPNRERL